MKKLFLALLIIGFSVGISFGYETLISATTDAETTDSFTVTKRSPVTIVVNGLAGVEEIELQMEYSTGSWTDIYNADDEQIVFSATKNLICINAAGRFRLVKPSTAAAVTVVKYSETSH